MPDKNRDKDDLPPQLRNAPSKFAYLKEAYKPEPDPHAFEHLGTMNGWGNQGEPFPEKYMKCQRKQGRPHKLIVTHLGKRNRGYHSYQCKKCNIEWVVDSTD